MDLRRQLSGIPGVIVRANAVGRQQPVESVPVRRQQRRRPAVARNPRRQPGRCAQGGAGGEGPARHRAGRGRCPARPRRRTSGAGGCSRSRQGGAARRQHHHGREHASARTSPARRRRCSARAARNIPIIVRLREDQRQAVGDVSDVLVSTPQGTGAAGEEPDARRRRGRPVADSAQEPAAHRVCQRRAGSDPERGGRRGAAPAAADLRPAAEGLLASASAPRSSSRPRRSTSCAWC